MSLLRCRHATSVHEGLGWSFIPLVDVALKISTRHVWCVHALAYSLVVGRYLYTDVCRLWIMVEGHILCLHTNLYMIQTIMEGHILRCYSYVWSLWKILSSHILLLQTDVCRLRMRLAAHIQHHPTILCSPKEILANYISRRLAFVCRWNTMRAWNAGFRHTVVQTKGNLGIPCQKWLSDMNKPRLMHPVHSQHTLSNMHSPRVMRACLGWYCRTFADVTF